MGSLHLQSHLVIIEWKTMSTEFSHWWKNQWPGAWSGDQCSPCQWKNVTWQVSDVRNCGCGTHSRVYFDCSLFACNYVSTGWVSELCEWRIFPNLSPGLERHPNPRHSWVIIPTRGSVSHRWWYSPTMNIFFYSQSLFSHEWNSGNRVSSPCG